MAKRVTQAEIKGMFWLIAIGFPFYLFMQLGESMGWLSIGIGAVAIYAIVVWYRSAKTKKRREVLMSKYQDEKLVQELMNQTFWQGQSSGQLIDSLGDPHDIDQKILKTKKKEVWKYDHQGGNRYGLRITLDDDYVVGWDKKT